jgi:hypothetical protein
MIHIFMEMLQETPYIAILNKQKYLFLKIREQEGKKDPVLGFDTSGSGGICGKGVGR